MSCLSCTTSGTNSPCSYVSSTWLFFFFKTETSNIMMMIIISSATIACLLLHVFCRVLLSYSHTSRNAYYSPSSLLNWLLLYVLVWVLHEYFFVFYVVYILGLRKENRKKYKVIQHNSKLNTWLDSTLLVVLCSTLELKIKLDEKHFFKQTWLVR